MYECTFGGCRHVSQCPVVFVEAEASAEPRWRDVLRQTAEHGLSVEALIKDVRVHVDEYLSLVESLLDVKSTTTSPIGRACRCLFFAFFSCVCSLFFTYAEDLFALAGLLELHPGELYLANVLYELFGGCTSVVCSDGSDLGDGGRGRPMLSRTLDWPFHELAGYTLHFKWVRRKAPQGSSDAGAGAGAGTHDVLFESVGWVGFVGIHTGVKAGAFSISLNARYPDVIPNSWMRWWVRLLLLGEWAQPQQRSWQTGPAPEEQPPPKAEIRRRKRAADRRAADEERIRFAVAWFTAASQRLWSVCHLTAWSSGGVIRRALEQCTSYEEVVRFLSAERLAVPCYFTVAGASAGEGVVIPRGLAPLVAAADTGSEGATPPIRWLERKDCPTAPARPRSRAHVRYLVQTNHDVPMLVQGIDASGGGGEAGDGGCGADSMVPVDFNSIHRYVAVERLLARGNWKREALDVQAEGAHGMETRKKASKRATRHTKRASTTGTGGGDGACRPGEFAPSDMAGVLTTSLSRGVGVRMQMTLYYCVMRAHDAENPMVAAKSTKLVGP